MKIGIFTDSHYSSAEVTCGNRYNNKSLEKIDEALSFFKAERCDAVICLGDLIDKEQCHQKEIENLIKVSEVFAKYNLETYAIMGNHDAFAFEVDEFYNILGNKYRPQNFCMDDKNFVFLDTCYFKNGKHYLPGDTDWTDTFLPDESALENGLEKLRGDVYVFMHQNIDREIQSDHRLYNDEQVRKILEKSGKVKMVFQGHYHKGNQSESGGIVYVTYPAMCENEKAFWVSEI